MSKFPFLYWIDFRPLRRAVEDSEWQSNWWCDCWVVLGIERDEVLDVLEVSSLIYCTMSVHNAWKKLLKYSKEHDGSTDFFIGFHHIR
jgi:hypothetical protein